MNKSTSAVLELGTNSLKCLIASIENGKTLVHHDRVDVCRLGEGLSSKGMLSDLGMQRCSKAFAIALKKCQDLGASQIHAVGTMALRIAKNRDEFIASIESQTGINIKVLSGEEEAMLAYLGATSDKQSSMDNTLVFDTGGGSTEFIFSSRGKELSVHSIALGANSLKEEFGDCDNLQTSDLQSLKERIRLSLKDVLEQCDASHIIGVGGTPVSLASTNMKLTIYDAAKIDAYTLSLKDIKKLIELFQSLSDLQRKDLPGMPKGRSDIIIYGTLIVESILLLCMAESFTVSCKGLRHGLMWKILRDGYYSSS